MGVESAYRVLQVIMNVRKSPKLERAHKQLDAAVARLEEVHASKGSFPGADQTQLAQDLELIRAENQSLKSVNETISGRLDATIGRLKIILES